jgi:hypothetical protein
MQPRHADALRAAEIEIDAVDAGADGESSSLDGIPTTYLRETASAIKRYCFH